MPARDQTPSHSLAASLEPFLRLRKDDLTVGEMLGHIEGDDGPGPVLLVLTLPVLLPLPPGFSMVLALPLLLVAPQIVIGRRTVWLPGILSRRRVKREPLIKLVERVLPPLERVETFVRPRLRFLTGRIGAAVVGIACTLIALVLVLPIPFANLVPALALGAFAIGLARRDGLFILAGYALIAAAIGVVILGVDGFTLGLGEVRRLV